MIDYKNNATNNTVEIVIEGIITETDFDLIISKFKADIAKHGKLRVLEEIRHFDGIDPLAL